jgi:hypothetical protein
MTTLSDLVTEVNYHVKRPDLLAAMESHIKNAILKLHTLDYWHRDLVETSFAFTTAAPVYQFEYKQLFPNLRKPKYLQTIDNNTGELVRMLTSIGIAEIQDRYKRLKDYVWYLAGDSIQIRTSDKPTNFGIGYYKYPDLVNVQNSWIVEECKPAVVYETCRTMFLTIGLEERVRGMEKLFNESYNMVLIQGVPDAGE